ncbi:MAG: tetratricopeptide repeat protein, partial [Candidatus Methylacidiphilales bacterium]
MTVSWQMMGMAAFLWILWTPFANIFHLSGQLIMAKLLGFKVCSVHIGQGGCFASGKISGCWFNLYGKMWLRGSLIALLLGECFYRTRRVVVLLAGTVAMVSVGVVASYALWWGMENGFISRWDYLPDVFLMLIVADALINLTPIVDMPRSYETMDAHNLWEILKMPREEVKWEVHCQRGDYCFLMNKKRMAAYHFMRAWRYIAGRTHSRNVEQIAELIFITGKARRACEMLVLLAERSDLIAWERSRILDYAASLALYEMPKPTMAKEAISWVSQALLFDSTNPSIRGTKGALCLEIGWMQDAKAHLQANMAWEDAPELDRAITGVCYARVLAWMGDLPAARKLLEATPTPREG